ncbi:HAD family hydrolase [Schlesneria paludicola]|uniref:HAD family hydrolase n=1 Tax=Schlesneria paludicola TaxID=360056 RepID=UPI00029A201F|nr:HAD family hydrolase [Schlesneria paludicola]
MRYHVLATDYDGTLATDGHVDEPTLKAMNQFLASGRHLVLVTGRELPELLSIFPKIDLFEWVVAENGGLLYRPSTKEERLLTEPPSEKLVALLKSRGVAPMSVGKSIIATWQPHESVVLESIRDLGLELQIIFNKGAVMILPAGVNKALGLAAALKEMGISEHNVIGIGDAENDQSFLRMCEFSVAVSNALPSVKDAVDLVTVADHGAGVEELISNVMRDDLASYADQVKDHGLALGKSGEREIRLPPYGPNVLICGPSGSGKSTVVRRIIEALMEQAYQFCLIDPEGDYEAVSGVNVLGGPKGLPRDEEVLHLLEDASANAIVCLTGMPISDRPPYFLGLIPQLMSLRNRIGHPHWLILDEAHHLMPAEWKPPAGLLPEQTHNMLFITVEPNLLAQSLLERIDTVIVVGQGANQTIESFAIAANLAPPKLKPIHLEPGELLVWRRDAPSRPTKLKGYPSKLESHRHHRKYAEGELPLEKSFYFQGADGSLNLRAQNLMIFLQLADGVDDATWEFHLHRGDYEQWFRECIKDEVLAASAKRVAELPGVSPRESRQMIRDAVELDYTLPATRPLPVPGAG